MSGDISYSLLDQIKEKLNGKPDVYRRFRNVMRAFKDEMISPRQLQAQLALALQGHDDVISAFNKLMPPEYQVAISFSSPDASSSVSSKPQFFPPPDSSEDSLTSVANAVNRDLSLMLSPQPHQQPSQQTLYRTPSQSDTHKRLFSDTFGQGSAGTDREANMKRFIDRLMGECTKARAPEPNKAESFLTALEKHCEEQKKAVATLLCDLLSLFPGEDGSSLLLDFLQFLPQQFQSYASDVIRSNGADVAVSSGPRRSGRRITQRGSVDGVVQQSANFSVASPLEVSPAPVVGTNVVNTALNHVELTMVGTDTLLQHLDKTQRLQGLLPALDLQTDIPLLANILGSTIGTSSSGGGLSGGGGLINDGLSYASSYSTQGSGSFSLQFPLSDSTPLTPAEEAAQRRSAFQFVFDLREKLASEPETYRSFISLLREHRAHPLTTDALMDRCTPLLLRHPDILEEFIGFLPAEGAVQERAREIVRQQTLGSTGSSGGGGGSA